MFTLDDIDAHGAGNTGELAGARVWNHTDAQRWRAAVHQSGVLEHERACAPFESASDNLEGNVTSGGAIGTGSRGEHSAFARGFKIAMELFAEEHMADG